MGKPTAVPASAATAPVAAAPAAAPDTIVKVAPPKGARIIDGGDVDQIVKFAPGDTLEGIYMGFKTTKGAKADETSQLHKVIVDGIATGIWGTLQLNAMLGKLKQGTKVWIAYEGKETIPGGNSMHRWAVADIGSTDEVPF